MAFRPFKGIMMLIVNKYAGMQKKGKWIENRTTLEKVENGIGSGNLGGKKYLMKVIINIVRKGIKKMEDKLISLTGEERM